MVASLHTILDGLGDALVTFASFGLLFLTAGGIFAIGLSLIERSLGGLIVRRGLVNAYRFTLRASRVKVIREAARYRRRREVRHGEEIRPERPQPAVVLLLEVGGVRFALANLIMPFAIVALSTENVRLQDDVHRAEYWTAVVVLAPVMAYVVYHTNALGILRAIRAAAATGPRESWPPVLPQRTAWISRKQHWNAARQLYLLHLHSYLVQAAIWASVLTIAITSYVDVVEGEFMVWLTVSTQLIAVLTAGAVVTRIAGWAAFRLETANQVSMFLQKWRPAQPDEPGRQRPPVHDRERLVRVVLMTERVAARLDRGQGIAVRHPVAHVLWLSAAHLRRHLGTLDSVAGAVPPEVEETLQRLAIVLIRSNMLAFLQDSATRLADHESEVEPVSRRRPFAERFPVAVDLTDRTTRLVTTLLVVGVVTWFAVVQKVPVTDYLQWLPV